MSTKVDSLKTLFEEASRLQLLKMEKLLEIQQQRIKFGVDHHLNTKGERLDFTTSPHIKELYTTLAPELCIQGSVQSFKGQSLDAPILTPDGWRKMGELQIGDLVSTPDGKSAPILQIQPLGVSELFRFHFSDGRYVDTTSDHLWKVQNVYNDLWSILTTDQIIANNHFCDINYRFPDAQNSVGPTLVKVTQVESAEAQCIYIDHPEHLYITNDYIVTHNTEWAVVDHLAMAYTGLAVFYVLPKYESRTSFVQNRINRCVAMVDEYKKIIGEAFFDNVALKSFGKGTVKYVGSNVLTDFKEYPGDCLVVDELDECHDKNIDYALDRLRASKFQFKRWIGNPKARGYGISAKFLDSDQREWSIPCEKCGKYITLDWFETIVESVFDDGGNVISYRLRDDLWEPGCGRDILPICRCGNPINRMHSEGVWVPQNPESLFTGYHFSMLCSPINPIAGMWDRFNKAVRDPGRLQHFYNSELGLPFTAAGNKVTASILAKCAEAYEFEVKPDCAHIIGDSSEGPCSMGVDVGGTLDVRISLLVGANVRKAMFIGKVSGFEDLHELIQRYNVEKCVIDLMPESTKVREFQAEAQCDVWACRYKAREGSDPNTQIDHTTRTLYADRTGALDKSFAALRSRKNILPKNFDAVLNGEYAFEMTGPVRQLVEDDRGNARYEWTKCKDHQRHCDSYDLMAATLINDLVIDDVCIG